MYAYFDYFCTNQFKRMSDKQEVDNLLRNIQKGLKLYSVTELNEAIITFLNKKNDKSLEIDKVVSMVCKEYSITKSSLKSKNARGTLQEAKQITYCLLHNVLGLSIRFISTKIFFNWPTSVAIGIKKLSKIKSLLTNICICKMN